MMVAPKKPQTLPHQQLSQRFRQLQQQCIECFEDWTSSGASVADGQPSLACDDHDSPQFSLFQFSNLVVKLGLKGNEPKSWGEACNLQPRSCASGGKALALLAPALPFPVEGWCCWIITSGSRSLSCVVSGLCRTGDPVWDALVGWRRFFQSRTFPHHNVEF